MDGKKERERIKMIEDYRAGEFVFWVSEGWAGRTLEGCMTNDGKVRKTPFENLGNESF